MRKGTAFMDVKHHEDYISDMTVDQARRIVLTARLVQKVAGPAEVAPPHTFSGFIVTQWRRHHGCL